MGSDRSKLEMKCKKGVRRITVGLAAKLGIDFEYKVQVHNYKW